MVAERFDPPQEPTTVVAHVAKDAAEAQLLAVNLAGAGIPAYVESDELMDHYAMSQKLMNRMGVRVLVMSDRVEEAREFIANRPSISDAELEAQAMADAGEGTASSADNALMEGMRRRGWRVVILLSPYFAMFAVLLFALAVRGWSALRPLRIDWEFVALLWPLAVLLVALAVWLLRKRS